MVAYIQTGISENVVLIITPDKNERQYIENILRSADYFALYSSYDTLVETAANHKPCLIILDADYKVAPNPLPILDALHADPRTKDVPVMLLVTTSGGFDVTKWFKPLEGRRIPMFSKPYSPEELLWYIANFLKALKKTWTSDNS